MTIITGVIVYLLIWWLTLFMVLPWKVQPQKQRTEGHADGAPESPMILRKLIITSLIALVLFAIVFALIEYDVISFRRLSRDMG